VRARKCLQQILDDVLAALFPEACRLCAAELESPGPSRSPTPSRLASGRLRRRLVGPASVPLRLLCPDCCARLRPCRGSSSAHHTLGGPRAGSEPFAVQAFEPEPAIFTLVHAFKYDGVVELAAWFGVYMARAVQRAWPQLDLLLVPVPLHARRLRERGFNQSALLAAEVGMRLRVPVLSVLERRHDTPPLAQLPHAERAASVRDAFLATARPPSGARIVLVDDVVTTGATSRAALAALDCGESAVLSLVGSGHPAGREPARTSDSAP
jgi:predicted amidophosphoribosyltransferase